MDQHIRMVLKVALATAMVLTLLLLSPHPTTAVTENIKGQGWETDNTDNIKWENENGPDDAIDDWGPVGTFNVENLYQGSYFFAAEDISNESTIIFENVSISTYENVIVYVWNKFIGDFEANDYFRGYVSVDGGDWIEFFTMTGSTLGDPDDWRYQWHDNTYDVTANHQSADQVAIKIVFNENSEGTGADNDIYSVDDVYITGDPFPPTISSITPSSGTNDGSVSITNLAGENFITSGLSVKLTKSGQPDINGTSVSRVSSSQITCSFDLTGAATSTWDVVVTTSGGTATLSNGFTVNAAQAITAVSVADGVNTLDNTALNGDNYLRDNDMTITITLESAASSVTIYYSGGSGDNDPSSGTSNAATGSGTSWNANISASNENVGNGLAISFNIVVDSVTYYRTGTENWSFKVDAAPPYNVGCATPENGLGNVTIGTSLAAQTASDSGSGLHSTAYYFQLATDNAFTQNVQNSGWQAGVSWGPSLTAGTPYYWRVKARDSMENDNGYMGHLDNNEDAPGWGYFTVAVGPSANVNSVTDGTNTIYIYEGKYLLDNDATVSIVTSSVSSVKLYYDDDKSLTGATSVTATGYGTAWSAIISASDANVHDGSPVYFVIEMGGENYCRTGTGISDPWQYIVDSSAPTGVALSTPINGGTGVENTPTLTVQTATDAGVGKHSTPYYFQLATDSSFTQSVQNSGWQASSSWSPATLSLKTVYYWRVKMKDALGTESDWRGHSPDTTGYGYFTTLGMFLSLTTDKDNYTLGEIIQISGTATNLLGGAISTGNVTVQFTLENWNPRDNNITISNGSYGYSYQTSLAHPTGEWLLTVTATDSYGNTAEISKRIGVTRAVITAFYTLSFEEPAADARLERGKPVLIKVQVKDNTDTSVSGAQVSVNLPSYVVENMIEDNANPGTYYFDYTVGYADPLGGYTMSVGAVKESDNMRIEGGGLINVEITRATLKVTWESPSGEVEVGQTVQIKVKALYPNGTPAEGVIITVVTPSGENLTLEPEPGGLGYYSKTYTIAPNDVGTWSVELSAGDLYGNSGTPEPTTIKVVPMTAGGFLVAYWWAFLAVFSGIGVASAYFGWRTILVRRLKRVRKELRDIPKFKKEAMIKYFKEGSIERDTYDEMMDKHDMRMGELRKQEELLSAKVEKRAKAKKAKKKRR